MRTALIRFMREHWLACTAAAVALVATGTVVTVLLVPSTPTNVYTAEFTATPGLYTSNSVDVLGVPTGSISSISAQQSVVRVTMHVPRHVKIPANVTAVLMAPNPVSDRFVELYPPYTSGPTLPDGAVIPVQRTAVPLELDQIFDNLDNLASSLGPHGANSNGSVSDVVHSLAELANGNGANLRTTLVSLAQTLPALTADPQRVAQLVDSLDRLSQTLAAHNATIDRLYGDLAGATDELAAERDTLGAATGNLQSGLAQLAQFLRANKDTIGADTAQLATTAGALLRDQKSLIDTFDTAALGFQNFINTVNPNAPCDDGKGHCPALSFRLDLPSNISSIVSTYCGTALQNSVPILEQSAGIGTANTINTMCVYELASSQGVGPAPGAPAAPDLGLDRFLR